ncbi:DHA2 family lincomycin resistance protein-like MFS transporter [Paenibacillus sp. PastF-1]|nr:DHA2 family lincomycin resistance protein-like MFS transporter [Paenibacillus sp. PastF-2]MDF9845722.1 DHA2 family lincomycin resistance protein-like MFS transporter [Paenibacillus sp. PastM-2]MDF9852294.1 DHA2 family lincomycin resistance protein-like MFS transporter [Paenibacillus sp. PastF-1]MDH6477977.1 DHA2 family lincomycin resistance protein-like MFS transporter [Paenibacillus sp. PastH-2]MDH6505712.1 DHA2 family lincomycin resistance protein-like MFS transporter [Paenibacillus sp. Pa
MEATMQGKQQPEVKKFKTIPILVSLLLAGFIGMFSETALNVALSDLMNILQITASTAQWLTTAYLLTLGILVPISGMLLQWFTTRQLFVAAVSFSIVGTFIAAMAPSFEILLLARVVQAMGTALLLPLMFNTILVIIPPEKRGGAMGLIGLVIMVAPAIGPTIAGLLISNLTWHWIFWLSLPFLAMSLISGILFMQNVSEVTKPKIDVLSIILSSAGFGGIVFGFSSAGEEGGWGSTKVIAAIAIGVIALVLFVIRQLTMKQPMINLRAFKYPMFTVAVLMIFICMMIILSAMLILPMYLQQGQGYSAFKAGLLLLPGGIINGLMSPIMGRLFDKYGPKWLVIPGLVVVAVSLWFFSSITATSTVIFVIVLHSALMIGISMIMMPAQTNGINQLPLEYYPHGTAIMNTLQQVAGAIGTALAVSIMTSSTKSYMETVTDTTNPLNALAAFTHGVQNAFVFGMVMAVIGLIVAFFIKRVVVQHKTQAPMH